MYAASQQPFGQKTDDGQEKIPAVTWARYSPETIYLCLCRVIHISSITLPGDVAREASLQVYLLFLIDSTEILNYLITFCSGKH